MATPCSTRNPLFLGRWFQDEVIIVAVRWYLTYPLCYRQVGDMLRDLARFSIRRCAFGPALTSIMSSSRTNHRGVKRRVDPMLGFQSFENARVVIAGIELAQKISQRPYDLRRWGGTAASQAQVWQRVMAA
jgi:transposase-like protein